ncbi:MAG TPA: hypothetical protein P5114_12090, partial [Hyphomicrobiaceae bacterium]|nr:hypothetical protein [Hyphomicrobiaceae bacterium]
VLTVSPASDRRPHGNRIARFQLCFVPSSRGLKNSIEENKVAGFRGNIMGIEQLHDGRALRHRDLRLVAGVALRQVHTK